MQSHVLVQIRGAVCSDALEALYIGCQIVQFRKSTTTLLLDANFDVSDPPALKLNALSDDFSLEPEK